MVQRQASPKSSDSVEELRKARKRATDRRAQRDHRQRRKIYVKQLEESVRALSEQHSSEQRIAALLAEQKRLQDKCTQLATQLDHIRSILGPKDVASPAPDGDCAETLGHEELGGIPGSGYGIVAAQALESTTGRTANATTADLSGSHTDAHLTGFDGTQMLFDQDGQIQHNRFDLWHDGTVMESDSSNDGLPQTLTGSENRVHPSMLTQLPGPDCAEMNANTAAYEDGMSDQLPPIGSEIVPSINEAQCNPLFSLRDRSLSCQRLPALGPTVGAADKALFSMIQEAKREHASGRFDTSGPSLKGLLADPPPNVLAFRLFHYLAAYGPMPFHLLLGIFWVQYLVLRWMVLETSSAYERIPTFLRPTSLECIVPHRLFIGMLCWPDIRRALIRDSDNVDPEAVGIAILQSLEQGWSRSGLLGQSTSLDVVSMIQQQAELPGFWSVSHAFFKKYPRYTDCRLDLSLELGN